MTKYPILVNSVVFTDEATNILPVITVDSDPIKILVGRDYGSHRVSHKSNAWVRIVGTKILEPFTINDSLRGDSDQNLIIDTTLPQI